MYGCTGSCVLGRIDRSDAQGGLCFPCSGFKATHTACTSSRTTLCLLCYPSLTVGVLACRRAKDLMTSNIEVLHKIADVLLEREQINGDEFQKILQEAQVQQYLKQDAPGITVPYQNA